jgi:acetyl-CoA acetyltransferase family protein
MADAYLVSAVRTPIGIGKPESGALWPYQPVDLAAAVLVEAVRRAGLPLDCVEDVILGCVTPVGDQGGNVARLAALQAGLPPATPAVSLNRMCGSGQQAVHFAAQAILAGDMDLVLAGGIEMMSHQPLGKDYPAEWPRGFPYPLVHQGLSAEMMAERWQLSRELLDDFAFESHRRAAAAIESGTLDSQILPLHLSQPDGATREISRDQGVRFPADRQKMASLKPVFKEDGVITAGNSSQISDGAAALLVASDRALRQHRLKPLARIVARVVVGSDPVLMLDGPLAATRKVLDRAGLRLDEIDLFEVNEAFACVPLAWLQEYPVDPLKLNANGGAIAHGHPLGATGGVLMTKLVHELQRTGARFGLQTMCIGHGMATATIVERM